MCCYAIEYQPQFSDRHGWNYTFLALNPAQTQDISPDTCQQLGTEYCFSVWNFKRALEWHRWKCHDQGWNGKIYLPQLYQGTWILVANTVQETDLVFALHIVAFSKQSETNWDSFYGICRKAIYIWNWFSHVWGIQYMKNCSWSLIETWIFFLSNRIPSQLLSFTRCCISLV